jgi:hypothetical protein
MFWQQLLCKSLFWGTRGKHIKDRHRAVTDFFQGYEHKKVMGVRPWPIEMV